MKRAHVRTEKTKKKEKITMDGSSEPDIIRLRRPVIDERPDGIYLYFHPMPSDLITRNPIHLSPQDKDPPPW